MTGPSYQTVRLARGRDSSRHAGVCVMELASMLAHEPFSDRAGSISPTVGAFLRTYNDGLDDVRRHDLYPVAAAIVGTAAGRAVERERVNRCLAFAGQHGARLGGGGPRWAWPRRAPPGVGRRGRRSRPTYTTRRCRWSMSSSGWAAAARAGPGPPTPRA